VTPKTIEGHLAKRSRYKNAVRVLWAFLLGQDGGQTSQQMATAVHHDLPGREKKNALLRQVVHVAIGEDGLNFQENEKTHQATFTNFRKSTRQTNRQNTPRHLNFQTNYERNVFIYIAFWSWLLLGFVAKVC